METFIVCIIIIVLTIVFAILGCKLSSKLELKSQYEKPFPDNLKPATEEEKDLLRQHFTMVGTINGGKCTKNLVEEWCQSLYVAYGIVVDARTSVTPLGDHSTNEVRYATVQINELKFEITLDNAVIDNGVIIFYSKDDKGQMVYRFAIRKEKQNETK